MHFTKVSTILFTIFAASIMAAPTEGVREEAAPGQEVYPDEPPASLTKRGFGCPGDAYQCSEHCRALGGGRTGGYCAGPWYLGHPTCTCSF